MKRPQEPDESLAQGDKSCGRPNRPLGRCQVTVVPVFRRKLLFFRNRPVGCFNRGLNGDDALRKALIAIGGAIPFHQRTALFNQFRP